LKPLWDPDIQRPSAWTRCPGYRYGRVLFARRAHMAADLGVRGLKIGDWTHGRQNLAWKLAMVQGQGNARDFMPRGTRAKRVACRPGENIAFGAKEH